MSRSRRRGSKSKQKSASSSNRPARRSGHSGVSPGHGSAQPGSVPTVISGSKPDGSAMHDGALGLDPDVAGLGHSDDWPDPEPLCPESDLGDIVVALLHGTLSSLRDGLYETGFVAAASLIADLADVTDDYLARHDG